MTLPAGPRPLIARISVAELERITPALDEAVAAWQRREYSRPRFAAAMRETLGRDPFRQARKPRSSRREMLIDLSFLAVSITFTSTADAWWQRAIGLANIALWSVFLYRQVSLLRADRKAAATHRDPA